MQSILIFYQLYQIDAGSISTTCVHFDLKYLLHFLSIFTPNLLHFKNLLRYFTVFYNTFSLKKNVCKPWFSANFSIFPSTLFCCENFFSIISLLYWYFDVGGKKYFAPYNTRIASPFMLSQSYPLFAYREAYAPLLCSYRGGALSHKTTLVQAHRGFRLLTLASYYLTIKERGCTIEKKGISLLRFLW